MINLYVYYRTLFLECQVVLLKILNHVERCDWFNMIELEIVTIDSTNPTIIVTVHN